MAEPKKPRKRRQFTFTAEYKAEVASLCAAGGRSIGQVANDLGLTETSVRAWVKRTEIDAGVGPPGALTTSERQELVRLRRELKRGLLREGEQVRFAWIDANRCAWPVAIQCHVLEVSRSGYYAWSGRSSQLPRHRR